MKLLNFVMLLFIFTLPLTSCSCTPTRNGENTNGTDGNNITDNTGGSDEMGNTIYLHIGETVLTATLVENSSTAALKNLLSQAPITIPMRDYGNFEKVGDLGTSLPRNDERITTVAGDLILYQGNVFVIYYAPNTYSFTRLGKINNVTAQELKNILGSGNVTVTLSLSQKRN
jgi:hypothetical protein